MSKTVKCQECGASILLSTAEKTNGLCMPCKRGIRKNIEEGKAYHNKLKQYDPYRAFWESLVNKAFSGENLGSLSEAERAVFLVECLNAEIFNGGFDQFFSNSSGRYYLETLDALEFMNFSEARELLLLAKAALFGDQNVSIDRRIRFEVMQKSYINEKNSETERLDTKYYTIIEQMDASLRAFAKSSGLIQPYERH